MHRLAIGEQDDAQPASTRLVNPGPAAYAAVRLDVFAFGLGDCLLNP